MHPIAVECCLLLGPPSPTGCVQVVRLLLAAGADPRGAQVGLLGCVQPQHPPNTQCSTPSVPPDEAGGTRTAVHEGHTVLPECQ